MEATIVLKGVESSDPQKLIEQLEKSCVFKLHAYSPDDEFNVIGVIIQDIHRSCDFMFDIPKTDAYLLGKVLIEFSKVNI
jgi:transcriptional regulator of NAD metabolism